MLRDRSAAELPHCRAAGCALSGLRCAQPFAQEMVREGFGRLAGQKKRGLPREGGKDAVNPVATPPDQAALELSNYGSDSK